MKIAQRQRQANGSWNLISDSDTKANLVLAFGGREELSNAERYNEIKNFYPDAHILMGSTSGEIMGEQVFDNTISLTAINFEKTELKIATLNISEVANSIEAGKKLAENLNSEKLKHVFVLSDGLKVNGSELVKGFNSVLKSNISVTGGLAGDAAKFEKTLVGINQAPGEGVVVAIGFYGDNVRVGHGSAGGWDPFGPERVVTKSTGNVLFELDGQSALQLYKTYLGDKASGLPGTGLLFPLSLKEKGSTTSVVRTLLAVNEADQSMTFAGDIPQGCIAQLMKANFDRLIDASIGVAEKNLEKLKCDAELAILISCVGRKLVLGQRIDEEVEEVRGVLGDKTSIIGFYSYGEISPLTAADSCQLHNQTMTITTISEN